jgi:hypothetical protein
MILSVYNSLIELVNSESNVVSSKIPDDPIAALKYFLQRVKEKILQFKVQT